MPHLGPIHYGKFAKFLEYVGCEFVRQRGSHVIYKRSDLARPIGISGGKGIVTDGYSFQSADFEYNKGKIFGDCRENLI